MHFWLHLHLIKLDFVEIKRMQRLRMFQIFVLKTCTFQLILLTFKLPHLVKKINSFLT